MFIEGLTVVRTELLNVPLAGFSLFRQHLNELCLEDLYFAAQRLLKERQGFQLLNLTLILPLNLGCHAIHFLQSLSEHVFLLDEQGGLVLVVFDLGLKGSYLFLFGVQRLGKFLSLFLKLFDCFLLRLTAFF